METVEARGGFVNKFEGDAALCVFGAPVARPNPAADALAAARTLRARLRRELPDIDFGIGVSAGRAVAGNVGAEHRYEYTVIGDPVNEAARLCEMAKEHPERLLASEAAVERAGGGEAGRWSLGEPIVLRGRDEATRLATVAPSRPSRREGSPAPAAARSSRVAPAEASAASRPRRRPASRWCPGSSAPSPRSAPATASARLPTTASPTARAASTVNSVWLIVPETGPRANDDHGSPSSRARSRTE